MSAMTTTNGHAAVHAPEGRAVDASIVERVIAAGDLSRLQPAERVAYYMAVCRSIGLNPLTKPFDYISLNGKLTLYATKNCTDQLRQSHGVSVDGLKRETSEGVHIVTAHVSAKDGRRDEDIGAVSIAGLRGEALSNALMKATTKAKRRATLSICGLSFVDESELEAIPDARPVTVTEEGVIVDPPKRLAPAPPASEPKVESDGTFTKLCERIDAAERGVDLNKVAAATRKARASGEISEGQYKAIVLACEKKAALLKAAVAPPPPPPMSEPEPADMPLGDDGPAYEDGGAS
jgi:hypothetical protein